MVYNPTLTKPADTKVRTGGTATLVFALEGGGKSHFCINTHDVAPRLMYLNIDRDDSHLLARYKGEHYVTEKIEVTGDRDKARYYCDTIEQAIRWAVKQKEPWVFAINNIQNWRELANTAFLPPGEADPKPRHYELSNNYLRRNALALEASNLYTVLTAPAGPKWIGEQKKVEIVKGEDALEAKHWDGFDFCITTKLYLFNTRATRLVRPVPVEEVGKPEFKAQVVTAKLKPNRQGVIIDNPTLKDVLEVVS